MTNSLARKTLSHGPELEFSKNLFFMSNHINTWPPLLLSRDGGGDYRGHVVAVVVVVVVAAAAAAVAVVVDERARLRREGIVVPVLVAVDLHSQI